MAGPKPQDFDKNFGHAVARERQALPERLSVERLAEQAGLKTKAVREIEGGTRPARLSEAAALANALNMPLTRLLGLAAPSEMASDEVRIRVAELENAMNESRAQQERAEVELAKFQQGVDGWSRSLQFHKDRYQTFYGAWVELGAELERRHQDGVDQ